jgi:ABC-type phosphate transport system substrate-binding protein
MAMNDEFLHRIRAEPPPHFIASLKARLDQLDQESLTRRSTRRRSFFVGCIIAGAALATGLFVARTLRSPPSDMVPPMSSANPSRVEDPHLGLPPRASAPTTADITITSPSKATGADRTPGPLRVGATVSIYPNIREAARYMNNNMNVGASLPEPTFSMMPDNAVFPSLCASSNSIDLAVLDRRLLPGELDLCRRLGKHIAEVKLGYEAIVLVRSNLYDAPKLSTRSIFLALARQIPNPLHPEELIANPNVTWDQVDSNLPSEHIEVLGPPLSAATGIAFRDLILKPGCLALPTLASLKDTDPEHFEGVCGTVRTDGVYRVSDLSQRAGTTPFDLSGYLQANPEAIALMGYPALMGYQQGMLRALNYSASSINGVTPTPSIIYSGSYPGARAVYLYANTAVPHMRTLVLAIWSSVGGAPGDTALIWTDPAEQRSLRQQVVTLPDLEY